METIMYILKLTTPNVEFTEIELKDVYCTVPIS